jgi:uncharacterized membrane protein
MAIVWTSSGDETRVTWRHGLRIVGEALLVWALVLGLFFLAALVQ